MVTTLLQFRTWRDLRATALAHNDKFHTHQTKQQAFLNLRHRLLDQRRLQRHFRFLQQDEQNPLIAIQIAGGVMHQWHFMQAFGFIRRYRPWRSDSHKYPWKRYRSCAEKLWYLGFIEVHRNRVYLPDEVGKLLAPLPRPDPIPPRPDRFTLHASSRDDTLYDLATMLGLLQRHRIRIRFKKWLPLGFIRLLNDRLRVPEDLTEVRSERQTKRIRFLHYIGRVSGLLAPQNGHWQPTLFSWEWLAMPAQDRWQHLLQSVEADLRQRQSLWERYELPYTTRRFWQVIIQQLATFKGESRYRLRDLYQYLQLHLPAYPHLGDALSNMMRGPLRWLGWVNTDMFSFALAPSSFTFTENARFECDHHGIWIHLPPHPHPRPYTQLLAFATWDAFGIRIDRTAIKQALEIGFEREIILNTVSALTQQSLPFALIEQIEIWIQEIRHLSIEQTTVITVHNPDLMQRLRSDWRMRQHTRAFISPYHILLYPHQTHAFRKALHRRKLAFYEPQPPTRYRPDIPFARELWLATKTYRNLGQITSPPLPVMGAVNDWLKQWVTPEDQSTFDQAATAFVETIRADKRGLLTAQYSIDTLNRPAIHDAIHQAYHNQTTLEIEYYSPLEGITQRNITPIVLHEIDGIAYIEAYCHRAEAERTFRFDRILRTTATTSEDHEYQNQTRQ